MPDLLVKLYELKDDWGCCADQEKIGITIRKPIGPEKHYIIDWMRRTFSDAWAAEADMALSNRPVTCFAAVKDRTPVGVACYDATALGFFGPIGVGESHQGKGTGKALLSACLLDMKLKGYGYAIIGQTDKTTFYERTVGAFKIPDSSLSVYKTQCI